MLFSVPHLSTIMSWRPTSLSVPLLLLLGLQSTRTHAPFVDFELPEIDGFPVETCKILFNPTPDPAPPITPTTTERKTTPPRTMKQLVVTTKKAAVQKPAKKPATKNTGTPIRPQPAPAGPIIDSLLHYLLANGRRHATGPLLGFDSFNAQPMGELPHKGYGVTSDRIELSSSSSEDSSDES